jgi:hypothetical protein
MRSRMTQLDWKPYRGYITDLWNQGCTAPEILHRLKINKHLEVPYVLSLCPLYHKRSNVEVTDNINLNTFFACGIYASHACSVVQRTRSMMVKLLKKGRNMNVLKGSSCVDRSHQIRINEENSLRKQSSVQP